MSQAMDRDAGVTLTPARKSVKKRVSPAWRYAVFWLHVAISAGDGDNAVDDAKDFAGRGDG